MRVWLSIYLTAGAFCAALGTMGARAQTPAAEQGPDAAAPGGEDPFAVLGGATSPRGPAGVESTRIKTEGSLYLRDVRMALNRNSRVNPDNRVLQLEDSSDVLETRLTATDPIDREKRWRWLFKGYAPAPSNGALDGTPRDRARVDELFVDWKGERWLASLGKRRINWGHAQGFNPVNVVVPLRNPLDPARETEGQPMLWVNHIEGTQSLDLIATRNYGQGTASDQNRWGLKWGAAGAQSDYALYYFDGERYSDGRRYERMLGGSFSANLFPGLTSYLETARFESNYRNYYDASGASTAKDDPYWRTVAGSTLSLGGKRRVTVEYFRNNQGYSAAERLNYFRAADAQLASGADPSIAREYRITGMNRDYLLARYQDEFRERTTLDLNALATRDRSYLLRAQAAYALTDYYEFRVVLLRSRGSRDSELGNNPVSGAAQVWLGANF